MAMKTRKNKNGTVSTTGMSRDVYEAINWILLQVHGTVEYDEDMDCFSTRSNSLITFNSEDFEELNKIKWQL